METEQVVVADEKEQETSSCIKQMIAQVEQQPELNVSEILVDKVMSSTPFQYNHMYNSIVNLGLHATELKAQSSYSTNTTSGATKKKQVFLDTVKEASTGFNCNMQQSEANVDVTESSNITTSTNTKAKKSLIGIRRQKNGRYGAVIRDPIRHKQVWLGTFDTVEQASKAIISKKSEFDEKLSLQGNCKENKPKRNKKQKINQVSNSNLDAACESQGRSSEVSVDKVKSTTPCFQDNHMDSSIDILGLQATELKAQSSNSTNNTTTAPESIKEADGKEPPFIREISRVELMANVRVTESSGATTSINPNAKISLIGIRKQSSGRYAAVITDRIRHKKVWLGTFDTVEEASKAYFSKKSEFDEKLSLLGNRTKKPKKNVDHIQPKSPVVAPSSVPNDQTSNITSVGRTTHIIGVHKRKTSGKYTSEITNPISKKKIWLGTFVTAEEASQAYQSKKLEFQKIVKEKQQQQCNDNQAHDSKQDDKEKLVNVKKEGNENVNCGWLSPESAGGSETEQGILAEEKEDEETSSRKQKKTQMLHSDDSNAATREGQERRSSSVEQPQLERDVSKSSVDKVKSTPFQYNQMNGSVAILGLPVTELKAQNSNSTHSTATAAESSKKAKGKKPFIREISRVELMANVHVTESSNSTTINPKAKRSLIGIRSQKNGRYGAFIKDPIRHKQVWLGTFDTVEQASEAYFSKKTEFEKLSLQGNDKNRPKKNSHHIQPESPDAASLSLPNNQTLNTSSVGTDSHKATHVVGVNKSKTAGKYTSEITNPVTKKKIWLGTFGTAEEASQAYQSKKLEFQKLVKAKRQLQCSNEQTHDSKQDRKETLVNVKQHGHENVNCELFQPELAGGSETEQVVLSEDKEETGSKRQMITQVIHSDDSDAATREGQERRSLSIEQEPECDVSEMFVDKVMSSTPFQHNQMESSIAISGLHATELKAQNAYSTNSTTAAAAAESSNQADGKKPFIREISRVELTANVHVTESSNTTSTNPKAKRSLIGIRRQKNGRYGAVIRDPFRHKQIWLGTFDTVEEASEAIISKKAEFEKLSLQGNKEKRPKRNSSQIQPESPDGSSLSMPNNQTSNAVSVGIDSHKTTRIVGVNKSKTTGKYTSEITNPINKKKIWLGTFATAEEASQAYQSKTLEFQKLVKAKQQQQCINKQTCSKQDAKEKLVSVKQEHQDVDCQQFQPESTGGLEFDLPISNLSTGGTDLMIDSHNIGIAREGFHAYQFKKFDFQSSKNIELQSDMPTDPKQQGQEDEDLSMEQWVQLPGDREVKFSQKLGLPIIDNYGSLLGEFSSLDDDLSICKVCST